MTDYVRVKDPTTGHEFTTSAQRAKNAGLQVLSKPAVDRYGRVRPTTYHTPKKATGSKPGETDTGDAGKEH